MAVTTLLSWMNSSKWVRLRMRMHGCAAACANSSGSRWSWLMRWPHSAQGQWPSAPFSPRSRPARDGSLMRDSSVHRHAYCYVIAIFRRQSGVADPVGQAEPAKNLHRARRDLVALDVRWLAGMAGLGHRHIDAARGKFHRQCQPDRTGAANQYAGIE